MRYRSTLIILVSIALLTSACATVRGSSQDAGKEEPPTMIRGPQPQWRLQSPAREGVVLDLNVKVEVDSAGHADIGTLRVTGRGSLENQEAVRSWIQNASFRPALQAGRPVAGVFKTRIMLKAEIRRIG